MVGLCPSLRSCSEGLFRAEQPPRLRRLVHMLINELLLRARLRRMQAEAVLDPTARKALVDDAEALETMAAKRETASGALQSTTSEQAEPPRATASL
jgi:hypothetical protein